MRTRPLRGIALAAVLLLLAVLACGPQPSGGAPGITISQPVDGATATVGQIVEIISTATADAGVARVELAINGQVVRTDMPPSGNPTVFAIAQPWTPVAEGDVTVSVVAYDMNGASSPPASITLHVGGAGDEGSEASVVTPTPGGVVEPTATPVADVEAPEGCSLNASYAADVTIPDDTQLAPGTAFVKTWRLRNSGSCDWGEGFHLIFVSGDQLGAPASIAVPATVAGSTVEVSVNMTAPATPGTYRSNWRMQSDTTQVFGSTIYVRIIVPAPATATPTEVPVTATPTQPPSSGPTNLQATMQGDGTVLFTWNDAVGEAQYRYEISVVGGGMGAAMADTLPADTTSWNGGSVGCNATGGFTLIALAADNSEIGRATVNFSGPPCGAEPETTQVYAQVTLSGNSTGNVAVNCPADTVVTGGGYAANADIYVYNSSMNGNGWRVYGNNRSGTDKLLNVYAICMSHSGGTTSQIYSQASGAATLHAEVSCPAGSIVTGGGFAGNHNPAELYIYNSSRSGNGWQVYAHYLGTSSGLLNAYAICLAGTSATSQQVYTQVSIGGNTTGNTTAECPAGSVITGGGFAGNDNLWFYNTSMNENGWRTYARNLVGSNNLLNSYAICTTFP